MHNYLLYGLLTSTLILNKWECRMSEKIHHQQPFLIMIFCYNLIKHQFLDRVLEGNKQYPSHPTDTIHFTDPVLLTLPNLTNLPTLSSLLTLATLPTQSSQLTLPTLATLHTPPTLPTLPTLSSLVTPTILPTYSPFRYFKGYTADARTAFTVFFCHWKYLLFNQPNQSSHQAPMYKGEENQLFDRVSGTTWSLPFRCSMVKS